MLVECRHITIAIARSAQDVYRFTSEPQNVPQWAAGLAGSIKPDGDTWVAESSMGRIRVRFTPRNEFLVLDHDVTLPSGDTIHNPMRVLPNGDGCEVVFSLFRRPGVSKEAFEEDARAVARDLEALKMRMERGQASAYEPGGGRPRARPPA